MTEEQQVRAWAMSIAASIKGSVGMDNFEGFCGLASYMEKIIREGYPDYSQSKPPAQASNQ